MSSSPPPETEFPINSVVQDWEVNLLQLYRSTDPEDGPRIRSRMESLKVNSIRHYKEKRHVEHEYLIAEISDPALGQLRYLRIERTAADPQTLKTQDTTERSPRPSVSTLSSQSSLGVSKQLPALDKVSITTPWPSSSSRSSDILLEKLHCENSKLILRDVAIAANVVHNHSDKYQLFTRQCFWYAHVVGRVLEKNFSGIKREVCHSDVGDATREAETLRGTYKGIRICLPPESLIEEISNLFKTHNTHIESTILEAAEVANERQERLERAQKEKERTEERLERTEERLERSQKETEEERKEKERLQKEMERALNEITELKRRVQDNVIIGASS